VGGGATTLAGHPQPPEPGPGWTPAEEAAEVAEAGVDSTRGVLGAVGERLRRPSLRRHPGLELQVRFGEASRVGAAGDVEGSPRTSPRLHDAEEIGAGAEAVEEAWGRGDRSGPFTAQGTVELGEG